MNFTALVHEDEAGGFWAEVKELPGCITQGDSEKELEENLVEAIELILGGLIEDYVRSIQSLIAPEESKTHWRMELRLERSKTPAKR